MVACDVDEASNVGFCEFSDIYFRRALFAETIDWFIPALLEKGFVGFRVQRGNKN